MKKLLSLCILFLLTTPSVFADKKKTKPGRRAKNRTSVGIVNYFSGKDELCQKIKMKKVNATLRKFVLIREHYNDNDSELHCTLTVRIDKKVERPIQRFSSSKTKCLEILSKKKTKLEMMVSDDHLCSYKFVDAMAKTKGQKK